MSWPGIDQWVGGPHERELVPMSWEELGRLAEAGWEIGSPHALASPLDAGRRRRISMPSSRRPSDECEERLDALRVDRVPPYGDHDDRVVEAARRAGYVAAGTLPSRLDERGPLRFPRVGVYYGDDERRFRLKVSRPLRALRASRLWDGRAASPYARWYGMKMPDDRKRVLSAVVETTPSDPPSLTVGRWNSQIARMPPRRRPGRPS